jgi:hypothetical protein
MAFARKVVLHTPNGLPKDMAEVAERLVEDGVAFVAAVGPDCEVVEEIVDETAVGDGSTDHPFILTSSHPNETLQEAIAFARQLTGEYAGDVQVVELP